MLVPRAKVTTSNSILWLKHRMELLGCYNKKRKEIIGYDPLVRENDPQRQNKPTWSFDKGKWPTKRLLCFGGTQPGCSLKIRGNHFSVEYNFRLVLCDDSHEMSLSPKTVYPRAHKVKNVKHILIMKVKLKKDFGQVKVNVS